MKKESVQLFPWLIAFVVLLSIANGHSQLVADGATQVINGTVTNLGTGLIVGTNAPLTELRIVNGGRVTNSSNSYIGYDYGASNNLVRVDGSGSIWAAGVLTVGGNGPLNQLVVTNGGAVVAGSFSMGYLGTSTNNELVVAGTNSSFRVIAGFNTIKGEGNLLTVKGGGNITCSELSLFLKTVLTVTGPSSTFTSASVSMYEGNRLVVSNGATMVSGGSTGVGSGNHSNTVVVTGPGSLWRPGFVTIGNNYYYNRIVASNGATISTSTLNLNSISNYVDVIGPGSFWTNSGTITVGGTFNQMTVSNGGWVSTAACGVSAGQGRLIFSDAGTQFQVHGDLNTTGFSNRISVLNGGSLNANQVIIGSSVNPSVVTVSAGDVTVTNALRLMLGAFSLNSGTVKAGSVVVSGGRFVHNGGLLQSRSLNDSSGFPFSIGDGTNSATFEMLNITSNYTASSGFVINSNALFRGSGNVVGNLTVKPGGMLSPGGLAGAIFVGSNLALSNGSLTMMDLDATSGHTDLITVGSKLTYGGTLQLTNLSGTLRSGDTFMLFSAATYAGAFTNIIPATPGPGLKWNLNGLPIDGRLRVAIAVSPPPIISAPVFAGTNFTFGLTGGDAFQTCYLLASTNAALPLSSWSRVQTNLCDVNGRANFSVPAQPNESQKHFTVQLK